MDQQLPIQVHDENGSLLGDFIADLVIEQQIIVEIKACTRLAPGHTAQILGYLRATNIRQGILINFGSPRLEIRKFIL